MTKMEKVLEERIIFLLFEKNLNKSKSENNLAFRQDMAVVLCWAICISGFVKAEVRDSFFLRFGVSQCSTNGALYALLREPCLPLENTLVGIFGLDF